MEMVERASDAERRPTGKHGVYLIAAEQVHPRLLERIDSGAEPVAPRPASTIVLVRDAGGGPEVLLLQRPLTSSFAPGAWVFPGGAVDEEDVAAPIHTAARPDWSGRLGVSPRIAHGFVAAALREAWEETGILLADPAPDAVDAERTRAELVAGRMDGATALRILSTRFAADRLVYLAHWITPEPEAKRFDTRFFLAAVDADTDCRLMGAELAGHAWLRPADAVERYDQGEMRLLPPTVHTLDRLSRYTSAAELTDALRAQPVAPILPRMRRVPEGVLIEITSNQFSE